MIKISEKELQSVSSMGAFDRYRHFIKRIADSSALWVLKNGQNEYGLSEVENNLLLSVWSAEEYTQSCLKGVWENYLPTCLGFDEFNNELAPLISKMGYLIDVFPVNSMAGFVVTLDEFLHDLNVELDKY
jgi:hypothetical protein